MSTSVDEASTSINVPRRDRERRGATLDEEGAAKVPYYVHQGTELLDSDESEDEWTENGCNKWRKDKAVHAWVRNLSESYAFNAVVLMAVMANIIFIFVDLNANDLIPSDENREYFKAEVLKTAEQVFLGIYTVEFVAKVYAEPQLYWKSGWNIFDLIILIICYVQVLTDDDGNRNDDDASMSGGFGGALPTLRTLRALKALRALRTISFIRGLQVIFNALVDTMKKSFVNVLTILMFVTFLFAILFNNLFYTTRRPEELEPYWENLISAFGTLWQFVTVDGWKDRFDELVQVPDAEHGYFVIMFITIFFILLAHFLIFNIMIGMNIMNIQEANENYHEQIIAEKESILARKKELILHRQHEDVRKLKEKQVERDCSDFFDMVRSFEDSLKSDDYVIQDSLVTDPAWLEVYLQTLHHMYDRTLEIRQFHVELADIFKESLNREIEKRL